MKHTTLIKTTFLLLGTFLLNLVSAQQLSYEKAYATAHDFLLKANAHNSNFTKINTDKTIEMRNGDVVAVRIFQLQPMGYIVVSSYGESSPVIGYSFEGNFPNENELEQHPLLAIIDGINKARKNEKNLIPIKKPRQTKGDPLFYGPYVSTLWGQVNCFDINGNLINVSNLYTPNNYAPGCVAISMATLLHHYKWPIWGVGSHSYNDAWGSSTGYYATNFDKYYDWENMKNKYRNQSSTMAQREAVGELVFDCDVALEMDFEYNGSTSNVNRIPGSGDDYFRFHSFYKQESSSIFWGRVDKNMMEGNPVIFAISGNGNIDHSIVCDGLNIDGDDYFYHLNMGWWGVSNGWFTVQDDFNAGGYNNIYGGVLDFIPIPILYDAELLSGSNMFHLNWEFTQTISATDYDVQRKINNGDWETIADDYQDTTLLVIIDDISDNYYFRVRARVNDEIYSNSWSNEIHLDILTGTEEPLFTDNLISVFPNPFSESFTMDMKTTGSSSPTINIYNVTGELVYQLPETQSKSQLTIQTEGWQKGVYFIKLDSGTESSIKKIIKY